MFCLIDGKNTDDGSVKRLKRFIYFEQRNTHKSFFSVSGPVGNNFSKQELGLDYFEIYDYLFYFYN